MNTNFLLLMILFTCVIFTFSSAQSDTIICEEEFDETIFINPEIPPIFDKDTFNSEKKLMKYVYANLRINSPLQDSIAIDMIVTQFTVTKKGEVKDVLFRKGARLAEETNIRKMLLSMPLWTPGKMYDKPVDMSVTFPLRIELKD